MIATILISILLALIVAAVLSSLIRDKKRGKSTCGCNCSHCAMGGACHGNKT